MDLLSKWNQIVQYEQILTGQDTAASIPALVQSLLQRYTQLWYSREGDIPAFPSSATHKEQARNGDRLNELADGLVYELKHIPTGPAERQGQAYRVQTQAEVFARQALHLEQRHLDLITSSRLLEASQDFVRMARAFDPQISAADIYQAGRNVMTMNLIQLLLGLPVEVTPAIFAYSMLYPYTDNYLDDPDISSTTKLAFNHRFQERLAGETIRPANAHEVTISELVGMIEKQWERARYPRVYDSLQAIQTAQVRSLSMAARSASPYELDILGLSFEKGGTSVLADGYLVAGRVTSAQASVLFGYGVFTQLMDDLEDIVQDIKGGQATVFSQTASRWPLDRLTNRLFHLGRAVFSDLSAFHSPAVAPLKEIIDRCVDVLLIDSAQQVGQFYSKEYLRKLEEHFPFHFADLQRQREKLKRQKISLERVLEAFILQPEIK